MLKFFTNFLLMACFTATLFACGRDAPEKRKIHIKISTNPKVEPSKPQKPQKAGQWLIDDLAKDGIRPETGLQDVINMNPLK